MPVITFDKRDGAPWVLTIHPWGHRHCVPELAEAGIRYMVAEGEEDRCFVSVSELETDVWLNADSYDIDIVPPTPSDRLKWDICANGGWCGGILDGERTWFTDLLPPSGTVTAENFARLVVQAEGGPRGQTTPEERFLRGLEAKFIEHLGAPSVDAELLHRISRRPFDSEQ